MIREEKREERQGKKQQTMMFRVGNDDESTPKVSSEKRVQAEDGRVHD